MSEYQGPVMLSATSVLKPPPLRVSRITEDIKLPRAVPVKSLIAVSIGSLLGLLVGLPIGGYKLAIWLVIIFGGVGYLSVSFSPLKGENLSKYLGLRVRSSRTSITINGEQVRLYVGLTRITRKASGHTSIRASAVEIYPGSYDERGVKIRKDKRF